MAPSIVRKEAQRGYLPSSYGHYLYGDLMKDINELADAIERGDHRPTILRETEA